MPHQGRRAVAALCLLSLVWLLAVAAAPAPAGGGRIAEPATWSQAVGALWSQIALFLGVAAPRAPAPPHAQLAGSGSGSGCDGSSGMDPNGPNPCK